MSSEAKDENPEHINLKVMGQDGNIVQFKIKKHTAPMLRLPPILFSSLPPSPPYGWSAVDQQH